MKGFVGLLLFVLIQTAFSLQSSDVQGRITDLQSNQPLRNVRVTLTGPTQFLATTDAEGKFSLSQVDPGEYRVALTRDGFIWAGRQSGPAMLTVTAGQNLKNVSFKLLKTSAISGRILSENGSPLTSLTVTAMQLDYRNGRRGFVIAPSRNGASVASLN